MSNTDEIRNNEDTLDTRDIRARLDYLDVLEETANDTELDSDERDVAREDREAAEEEYNALTNLWDTESDNEWEWGATLIHTDYFEEYARELADELGFIDREASWPVRHIDWEAAANELAVDYREVEFDGATYLVR